MGILVRLEVYLCCVARDAGMVGAGLGLGVQSVDRLSVVGRTG